MLPQPASAFEIIQIAAQKRAAQASLSRRGLAANANTVGPAHIRAALMFAARKTN
ncbi:MAG: hypothetical protein HC779_05385 [Phyllobacteriaceae bacterium]|jgi:hypothetical protein|nr:hypothetical protein [Phyllobacteriaceae bacterium]